MLNEILLGSSIVTVSGLVGFFISKKITSANFDIYVDQAKAKASAIENEAQTLLQKSSLRSHEIELEAQNLFDSAKKRAKADLSQRENDIVQKEQTFKRYKKNEEDKLYNERISLEAKKVNLQRNEKSL